MVVVQDCDAVGALRVQCHSTNRLAMVDQSMLIGGRMSFNLVFLGLATTLSPLFLLATVIMMSSSQKVRTSWAAVLGWFVSIGTTALAVVIVGGAVSGSKSHVRHWWMGALDVALGVLMGVLAWRSWRLTRNEHGNTLPKWVEKVGSMSVVVAFGLGLFLPPTVLAIAAGNEIIQQRTEGRAKWTAVAIYALVGTTVELLPVLWLTLQPAKRGVRLSTWNAWLKARWREELSALFAVISLFLIAKGFVAIVRKT